MAQNILILTRFFSQRLWPNLMQVGMDLEVTFYTPEVAAIATGYAEYTSLTLLGTVIENLHQLRRTSSKYQSRLPVCLDNFMTL